MPWLLTLILQLYTSAHPDNLSSLLLEIQNCCDYVEIWMHENKLRLNNDKTEVLLCSTESKPSKVHNSDITLGESIIAISDKAKNFGVILDNTFSMEHQINAVIKAMYFEIRNISRMKSILSYDSVKTLVSSLVLSRLDYCNSLLAGITEQKNLNLQKAQNCAARLILGRPRSENAKLMLRTLHWLPVKARIEYKISVLCYNTLHSSMPSYLKDFFNSYVPERVLRSQDSKLLIVPKSNLKTFSDRAFTVTCPIIWNSLPFSLRTAGSVAIFRKHHKTFLFNKYL